MLTTADSVKLYTHGFIEIISVNLIFCLLINALQTDLNIDLQQVANEMQQLVCYNKEQVKPVL